MLRKTEGRRRRGQQRVQWLNGITSSMDMSFSKLQEAMDYSPPSSSLHGDSSGKNTEVDCHGLLQGIFPTQRLNRSLPLCRWILYHLNHKGSSNVMTIMMTVGVLKVAFIQLKKFFLSIPSVLTTVLQNCESVLNFVKCFL